MTDELHTADEWCAITGIVIYSADGWRIDDTPYDTPLTREQFFQRVILSTAEIPHGPA